MVASVASKTRRNASVDLICAFIMQAHRLIDTRRGSPKKGHYVNLHARAHIEILDELSLHERLRWMDSNGKPHNFDGLLDAWLDATVDSARRSTNWSLSPNPPKRWSLALTPWMMGKGRRTG